MVSEREKKLENVLVRFLEPVRGVPFEVVIKALCGKEVVPFNRDHEQSSSELKQIIDAMRSASWAVRRKPIRRPRPNEVGNDMEPFVVDALRAEGLDATYPRTVAGKGKTTGYPDVRLVTPERVYYIEVKTYAAANHNTTQRSFYLSPSTDHKVGDDACHLLVGFEMERDGDTFVPNAFRLVDLYGLECDMKAEFQSDNRRLYEGGRELYHERLQN